MNIFKDLLQTLRKRCEILLIFFVLIAAIHFKPWHRTYIVGDGTMYYVYLPSIFIYKDLDLNFCDSISSKYYSQLGGFNPRQIVEGGTVSDGFIGVSILIMPAFIGAHLFAFASSFPADGFSAPYQYATLLAAILWLWLGLFYLRKLLEIYNINGFSIVLTLSIVVFGTPLLHYTVVNSTYTHIFSFSLIVMFFYFLTNFFQTDKKKSYWLSIITLGLIILVRPINGLVVLLIPAMAGSWTTFKAKAYDLYRSPTKLTGGFFLLLAIIGIQPFIYFIQTGSPIVCLNQNEGFNFTQPRVFNYLFSFKNGLLIYTPSLLLAALGIPFVFRRSKLIFFSLSIFLLFMVYILSSWWNWWYGMSFGQRSFVDFLGIIAIFMAFGIDGIKNMVYRYSIALIGGLLIILSTIQMTQFNNYIFYWEMNSYKYWRVFLRTAQEWRGVYWENARLEEQAKVISNNYSQKNLIFRNHFENTGRISSGIMVKEGITASGLASLFIGGIKETEIARIPIPADAIECDAFLVQTFCFPVKSPQEKEYSIQFSLIRSGKEIFTVSDHSKRANSFHREWNKYTLYAENTPNLLPTDSISIKVINLKGNELYIDDLNIFALKK